MAVYKLGVTSDWITPVLYLNTEDGVVFPKLASSQILLEQKSLAKLDFGQYIDQKTEGFVGRDWLFQQIDDWLSRPESAHAISRWRGCQAAARRLLPPASCNSAQARSPPHSG